MKNKEIIFGLIKIPFDFLIVIVSFLIWAQLRIDTTTIPLLQIPIEKIYEANTIKFAIIWAILYLLIFFTHNMYNLKLTSSKSKEIFNIVKYSVYWFFFFSITIYFMKWVTYEQAFPRLIIIYTTLILTWLTILSRIFLIITENILLKIWIIKKRNILLISNEKSDKIEHIIKDLNSTKSFNIVGYINNTDLNDTKINYLGWLNDIQNIFTTNEIFEILYINSWFSNEELYEIWDLSRIHWINYSYIPNRFDITKTKTVITNIKNTTLIELQNTPIEWWWKVFKRFFDILSSFVWIILFSPIFILVWILIKLEDPAWPIIYKNRRVWEGWRLFDLFKFRYMKWEYCIKESYWIDNKKDSAVIMEKELIAKQSKRTWPLYKIENDPRKTRIWYYLEKFSIDELPQLFNVFLWTMSLIWPRPHQPREVEKYDTHHKRVLTIKPWISWLAQVNWRENNTFDDEVKHDVNYIENWNLLLDLKVILKTILVIIKRK